MNRKKIMALIGLFILLGIAVYWIFFRFTEPKSAQEAIVTFDAGYEDRSFYYLDRYILDSEKQEELLEAAINEINNEDPNIRFAALYALIQINPGENLDLLINAFEEENESIRILATTTAMAHGEISAIPYVIEALDSPYDIPFSRPLESVSAHALEILQKYTGAVYESSTEWQSWWNQVESSLSWNESISFYQ